jgi:Pectate lyase superfamily protein
MNFIEEAEMRTCPMQSSRRDLFGLGAAAGMAALLDAPRIASAATVPNALPVVDVKSHGAAGDGAKDDTAAFQRSMDAAHAQGGGIVYAPPGRYLFHGTLNVPLGVTLRGSFSCVPSHTGLRNQGQSKPGDDGTALYVTAGRGSEDGTPFLTLNTNSSVCGMTIYYPEQIPDGEPAPYPWTIAMRGKNPAVFDLELLNPYQGIDASRNERHNIRNVTGQPLWRGIWVDAIYDIGRIENVHFNPWWSNNRKLYEWQLAHGEAFIFGRSDWEYVLNTFCFAYKVGYKFVETATGGCNGNFLGIGADDCNRAIVVEQAAEYGLLIANGEFTSFHGDDPTMIEVSEKNRGVLRVSNSAFWGPCDQIAKIAGSGTVGFSDCTFVQWGHAGDRAAIQAASGALLVQGCEFRRDLKQISLGSGVDRAVISGNLFTGSARIENGSNGDVQIGLNSTAAKK